MVGASGALALKSIRANQREADFIASTDAVDSHGEVIDQSSWVLEHYVANPVVLYAHDSRELPIGKATNVGVRSGRLEATIQFASAESNPMAEQVWRLIQEGFLRAVSVGFVPTDGRYEVRDGAEVFVWTSPVLKEISVVPVPANHEALSRMKSAIAEKTFGRLEHGETALYRQNDKCRVLLKADGSIDINPPAPPENTNPSGNAEEETDMSDATMKSLQDKVEALTKDYAKLEVERDNAAQMAAKSEDGIKTRDAQIKTLTTERDAFEAQAKTFAAERDAANAKVAEFEAKTLELEVDALVGEKITPAEKDIFLDLRKSNPDLFKKMVSQRAPMKLTTSVTEKSDGGALASTSDDAMAEIEKLGNA
jgi:HK97 family phage prohead protease